MIAAAAEPGLQLSALEHKYISVDLGKSQLWLTLERILRAPVSQLVLMLLLLFSLLNNIWHICLLLRLMFLVRDLCWIKLQKRLTVCFSTGVLASPWLQVYCNICIIIIIIYYQRRGF